MGLIYQFYNLIPVLNVVENITLPVLMDGRKVNQERLNELIDILKLKNREKNLPNQLSGGQQQRVDVYKRQAIVKATAEYFGLKRKEKQGELGENEFYCIQCGAYKNKENAERQLQRLRDAGFSSYIIIKDVEDKTYRDYYA